MNENESYISVTAKTELILNENISNALKDPSNTEKYKSSFVKAFWLWFELTRGEPEQDNDGPRFLDLVLKFPSTEQK